MTGYGDLDTYTQLNHRMIFERPSIEQLINRMAHMKLFSTRRIPNSPFGGYIFKSVFMCPPDFRSSIINSCISDSQDLGHIITYTGDQYISVNVEIMIADRPRQGRLLTVVNILGRRKLDERETDDEICVYLLTLQYIIYLGLHRVYRSAKIILVRRHWPRLG